MTEAERLLHAKIPCKETGIEIRHSICDICAPGSHCGIDAYVKDGKIVKIEGTKGYPLSDGKLCVRGAANRQYIYREDRLHTPLRRVGPRGSGEFEEITWDEAYADIAQKLLAVKVEYGPETVVWYTGYSKWFRPWLHRIAYSFGSPNYATESSSCAKATEMAWKTITGEGFHPDLGRANVYIGWGSNPFVGKYMLARKLLEFKKRGGKIITIDPRKTSATERLADLHLQILPGTDGALALGLANLIIRQNKHDQAYIEKYVWGFEQYRALAAEFTPERTARITGVSVDDLQKAVDLLTQNLPATAYTPSAAVTHHVNGYNNMRAAISLLAILGCIDRAGGALPSVTSSIVHGDCGFWTREKEFVNENKPQDCRERVGGDRFPLWKELTDEAQALDIYRQLTEETPYPIKAMMTFGMNHKMFPESDRLLRTMAEKLDLLVAVDLFDTKTCQYADYVLPACTSLERSELKGYGGGWLNCTTPVIPPLYNSKNDAEIICDLSKALALDDALLNVGYEETMRYMISNLSVSIEELRGSDMPLKVAELVKYTPGARLQNGFKTKTGKLELYSQLIADMGNELLDPLPVYADSFDAADETAYPFTLITSARVPHTLHSRMHKVPWARSLHKTPTVDLHPADMKAVGVREGDLVEIETPYGEVRVAVRACCAQQPNQVFLCHGFDEANANLLVGSMHLDPYSGFPGYRQCRCALRKVEVENEEKI